ncbi:MAG: hypothetical protein ABWK05_07885 [Pyrobaculum sp.]
MVNVDVVVSSLISQAPLVAVVILYNKIKGVESRVAEIEKAVKSLEARLDSLETLE